MQFSKDKNFKLQMIVANDIEGGIGYKNSLPWGRHDGDMKWMKSHVKDTTLLMGHNTLKSLPKKKIPDTKYIVITKSRITKDTKNLNVDLYIHIPFILPKLAIKYYVIEQLNRYAEGHNETLITLFGGKQVYDLLIEEVDVLLLTTFQDTFECDTYIDRELLVSYLPHCGERIEEEDVVYEMYYKEPLTILV